MGRSPHRVLVLVLAVTGPALLAGCTYPGWDAPGDESPRRIAFALETVHGNLSFPVSVAFAPDGRVFYTERFSGNVRVIGANGTLLAEPFASENVTVRGEGGLLGLALHPDFEREPWVYVSFTRDDEIGMRLKVVRYRADGDVGAGREVVVGDIPANYHHAGGILEFGPDGMLYVSGGDAGYMLAAMNPWFGQGKIHRFTPDGDVPEDNPFWRSSTYSRGHRNVFGLAFDPRTDVLYATENGPKEGDELNRIGPGNNYGWPVSVGDSRIPWYADPLLAFTPPIVPTEAEFHTGDAYDGAYRNDLFFTAWKGASLHRVILEPASGAVLEHEVVLNGTPMVDVENGPDGYLYVTTASAIARVVPRGS